MDEFAAVHTQHDGRSHPRSIAQAMRVLRDQRVVCAVPACNRRASHIGTNDQCVCADHRRNTRLETAWARLRAARDR